MRYLRFAAMAAAVLASACTTTQSRPSADPGNTVRVDGRDYLVIACRGARSAGVACPAQAPLAAYFRGGVVCQPSRDGNATAREVEASTIPPSVCESLANGCEAAQRAPAAATFNAINDEERSRITALGFTVVPCRANSFRLEFSAPTPPPPPPVTEPVAAVDPDAGGAPSVAIVTPPTPEPLAPEAHDALAARTEAIRTALSQERTMEVGGIGLCATAEGESLPQGTLCVRLGLRDDSPRPDVVAQRFAEIARGDAHGLRLSFEYQPPMSARCAPNDPDCSPVVGGNVCPEALGIRTGGGRTPISTAVNAGVDLRRYESGRCRSDGDCVLGGCGQHCVAIGSNSFGSTCEGVSALDAAACGCVRGRCRWFVAASN
jgi:hypothetical protein